MKYTVVGYFEDNEQPFVSWVEADNPEDAVRQAYVERAEFDETEDEDTGDGLHVDTASYVVAVGVFEGHLVERWGSYQTKLANEV